MPFAAHLSTVADSLAALDDCTKHLGWEGAVDLAVVFFSPHHRKAAEGLAMSIQERWRPRALLGCPGETVIGNGREVEGGPALAVWLGRWGGEVQMTPFHLTVEETSEGYSILGWPDDYLETAETGGTLLTLADPFTFPVDEYLKRVNEEKPGVRVVGGMASGLRQPGECRLMV